MKHKLNMELESYDKAIQIKNKGNSLKTMPLLSWEFYIEHHGSLGCFKSDIEQLSQLNRKWMFNHNFIREFVLEKSVVIVTNPDLSIVFVSHNIEQLNGYTPKEVLGKSPKLFQGEGTCERTSAAIRKAVAAHKPFKEVLLNYKKDKQTYMCNIKGYPIFDHRGQLVNYIAFEKAA